MFLLCIVQLHFFFIFLVPLFVRLANAFRFSFISFFLSLSYFRLFLYFIFEGHPVFRYLFVLRFLSPLSSHFTAFFTPSCGWRVISVFPILILYRFCPFTLTLCWFCFVTCIRLTHSCLLHFSCYFGFSFTSYLCHAQGNGEEHHIYLGSLDEMIVYLSLYLSFYVNVKLLRKSGEPPMKQLHSCYNSQRMCPTEVA